ncbi:uncharacterized protein LOC141713140 [Apium graveolens]|uniref:uncharacterized protein LOC141713140 n=1 Tax=Apium graveolens TaxID=4045 RepID=UPI003D7968AB
MSVLISGPVQPGNDIDVYLVPLIEDLKLLWKEGIEVQDAYIKDHFKLKAMLFGTISDFRAYNNLSGYSVKGYYACPLCGEETDHIRLKNCKKCVYMGHKRWLRSNHPYRNMPLAFNGEVEERGAPPIPSGDEVFSEKNVFDGLIGTMLGVKDKVRVTITKLCWFFKSMSSKVIDPRRLLYLQRQIVETLCEVEMYFPPSFLTSWSRPEGCIAERYLIQEAIEFWPEFIPNVEAVGLPIDRHSGRIDGEGVTGGQQVEIDSAQWHRVHLCVLHNFVDVVPFVDLHKETISSEHPEKSASWIELEHNRTFIEWFKSHTTNELLQNSGSISDRNRGVAVIAASLHQSSNNKDPVLSDTTYFRWIANIWELDYVGFKVPVFDCNWVNNVDGVYVEQSGFVRVDLAKVGYKDDSFIMATQTQQVFYVTDLVDKKWIMTSRSNGTSDTNGTNGSGIMEKSSKRGIVNMLKVKKARTKGMVQKVIWNEIGQPIGKESVTLTFFIGSYARRNIPITCND